MLSGEAIDTTVKTAVQRFCDRVEDLKRSALSDAKQIEEVFLASFHDGHAHRAPELASLATDVADLIQKFNIRATEMMFAVASLLFRKNSVAYAAIYSAFNDAF